jgi:ATP-dependent helicase HrpB
VSSEQAPGYLLALAFPDRIARRREPESNRYVLASGKGAALKEGDPLNVSEFLVVADMHDSGDDGRIYLAAPLNPELLQGPLRNLVRSKRVVTFDTERGRLKASVCEKIGAITLRERPIEDLLPEHAHAALFEWLATDEGFARIPFDRTAELFRARVQWSRQNGAPSLPDVSDSALRQRLHEWLAPFVPAPASLSSITPELVNEALNAMLSWEDRKRLDNEAPPFLTLPSGKQRRLEYRDGEAPILEALIQELFGWRDTPVVGRAKTQVMLHILSPARRPIQVTKDLASFWTNGYPEVRKELRGRYPKHKWPEKPW